ncbi:MAG: polymer-forming cytoskeletal protein [Candidatus Cloacimonetes bacterium]|nr:polymer-forming cytoskeletal protein [Candidatus Cloacimonadota bacterium]
MFNLKNVRDTVIGKKTTLEGSLQSSDDIRILGKVTDDVVSKHKVTVHKNGSVLGKIIAKDSLIQGEVEGDLDISGKVELESSAKIEGNIQAKILKVHTGVVFNYLLNKKEEILIANVEK